MSRRRDEIRIRLPDWAAALVREVPPLPDDTAKMRLVLELARQNVLRGSGGPFGAAVFSAREGRCVAAGVNSVESMHNSMLHAEVMALMLAEARIGHYSLHRDGAAGFELFTSCAPCAMCLGGILWSGVGRVVCGARREDAAAIGFDEGPVFPESYAYLEARGIRFVHDLLADEARAVLELYRRRGGAIYNP